MWRPLARTRRYEVTGCHQGDLHDPKAVLKSSKPKRTSRRSSPLHCSTQGDRHTPGREESIIYIVHAAANDASRPPLSDVILTLPSKRSLPESHAETSRRTDRAESVRHKMDAIVPFDSHEEHRKTPLTCSPIPVPVAHHVILPRPAHPGRQVPSRHEDPDDTLTGLVRRKKSSRVRGCCVGLRRRRASGGR